MTRDEILGWLRAFLSEEQAHIDQRHDNQGRHALRADALRAAIALLTVPGREEIQAARAGLFTQYPNDATLATLLRALDALAHEPGLEARLADALKLDRESAATIDAYEKSWHDVREREAKKDDSMVMLKAALDHARAYNEVLRAKLARVRSYADWLERENVDERVAHALREMLADEATK